MAFDFAETKALTRRVVHQTFGVEAFYTDASVNAPIRIRARLHNRISRPFGDLDGAGYSEVIEGIDRIVLIPEDDYGFPVELKRKGIITIPALFGDAEFQLDTKEPSTGPLEESWQVTRK